ncbi:hypothetical protein GOP47_0028801 [Adiantum capillus-veneris]|nr:hypothetical protein GOP47_0028801 [Adiantum capillus-veneris]
MQYFAKSWGASSLFSFQWVGFSLSSFQVIQLMKGHLSQHDVFLAIDNVWGSSWEAAQRILGAGFSANSKILLTSRSEQVLKDLLRRHRNACVRPLPALEHDEAFQIFQEAFGGDEIKSLENCRDQVERIMEGFKFDGNYHALALKAFGRHVRKGCSPGDSKQNEDLLSRILQQIRNKDLKTLDDAIRLNYDIISEDKKHFFLDIAVLIPLWSDGGEITFAEAHQWLRVLFNDHFSETLISELALDGLLQLETDGHGESISTLWARELSLPGKGGDQRIVRVHDLYSDLAQREAVTRSRFFISGRSSKPLEEFEGAKSERVILMGPGGLDKMDMTRLHACPKLQVLHTTDIDFLAGIDMRRMPSLRVLYLEKVTLRRIKNWSAANSRLGIMSLSRVSAGGTFSALHKSSTVRVFDLNDLIQLQVLHVEYCFDLQRIEGLDTLKNLQSLSVWGCVRLENLDGLSVLPQLKALHVVLCERLNRMPDISRLTCLQELVLEGVLSHFKLSTTDFSDFTRLERLRLNGDCWMEELGGLSSSIRVLQVFYCPALKRMPDLSGLTCLVSLQLRHNSKLMEEVGCLSSTVKDVEIVGCEALRKMPDLSGLPSCLRRSRHSCCCCPHVTRCDFEEASGCPVQAVSSGKASPH